MYYQEDRKKQVNKELNNKINIQKETRREETKGYDKDRQKMMTIIRQELCT